MACSNELCQNENCTCDPCTCTSSGDGGGIECCDENGKIEPDPRQDIRSWQE